MNNLRRNQRRSTRPDAGFSLIELLISILVFTIVTGAIYQLLRVGQSDRFTVSQKVESIQNVRSAMNLIGRDLLNAGVGFPVKGAKSPDNFLTNFGFAADGDVLHDLITPVLPGDNLPGNTNSLNTNPAVRTDQITLLTTDEIFNGGLPLPITGISANGDLVAIDRSGLDGVLGNGDDVTTGICPIGGLYLITVPSRGEALGWMTARADATNMQFANQPAPPTSLGINLVAATGPIASIRPNPTPPVLTVVGSTTQLLWITYKVNNDGTLVRRVYGDPALVRGSGVVVGAELRWIEEPLAFGVEDMQIDYLLRDGTITANPTALQSQDIRQVRLSIRARGSEVDPRTRLPIVTTLNTTFATRNLSYRVK